MKRSDTTEMIIIVTVNFHRESTKNSVNNKQLKSNETMVKTTVDNALGFRVKKYNNYSLLRGMGIYLTSPNKGWVYCNNYDYV